VEDDQGRLWLGSERGVFSIRKADLAALERGELQSLTSAPYGLGDGMKNISVAGHVQRSACRSRDGRIWFATVRGVAVVDPNNLQRNERQPPVLIENVLLFGERTSGPTHGGANHERLRAPIRQLPPEALAGPVELEPDQNEVEVYYAALSYRDPDKVRFKYRLEGLDRTWVDPGPRRVAYYPRIPAGRYRFHVIAANNDGVWNETGASFAFRVKPRFHETPLFYALCVGGLGLVVFGMHLSRIRKMEAQHRAVLAERGRLARELHDTLLQGLSGIVFQLEAIAKRVALEQAVRARLEQILEQARSIMEDTRASVRGLRSSALDRSDLVSAIRRLAAPGDDGEPQIEVAIEGTAQTLPESLARNLLRIAQEAVANARKHAGAKRVTVRLRFSDGTLELRVSDDGPGITPAVESRPHFGLLTMRERATEVGGVLRVQSLEGMGTEVGVTVPLP
jgi:signal transduction histidine kinase